MGNITRCKDCGAVVSINAVVCPSCGAAGYHATGNGWVDKVFSLVVSGFGAYVAFGLDLGFMAHSTYGQYIRLIGIGVLLFGLYTLYGIHKDQKK